MTTPADQPPPPQAPFQPPAYPPLHPAAGPRPTSGGGGSHGWWIGGLIGFVVGAVVTGIAGIVLVAFMGFDGYLGDEDYMITSADLTDETWDACEAMQAAGDTVPLFGGQAEAAAALHELAGTITAIGATLDVSDADQQAWRRDLDELAKRVTAYADAVAADPLAEPDWRSRGLLERIWWGAPYECHMPERIEMLDADYD